MRISTTATVGPAALRRVRNLKDSSHDQHSEREKQNTKNSEDVPEKASPGISPDSDGLPHIDIEA